MPEDEAIEHIKTIYDCWVSLIDVCIEEGMAVIELSDENAEKLGVALDKIVQAAKLASTGSRGAVIERCPVSERQMVGSNHAGFPIG